MGMFDYKGQFPFSGLIEAAIQRKRSEEEARRAKNEELQQTLQNAGQAAGQLNKFNLNKQMAETLAQTPEVNQYLNQASNPAVATGPKGMPVKLGETAFGGDGNAAPVVNKPKPMSAMIQPYVDSGQGMSLLEKSKDMAYKNSTVEDIIPIRGADGTVTYQRVTRNRGGRTESVQNPPRPPTPRSGRGGQTPAQMMNTAVDNAMARLKSQFPFGAAQAEAAGQDFNNLRENMIKEEYARLTKENQGSAGGAKAPVVPPAAASESHDSLPSAASYSGKVATDTVTGKKYKSNGSKWVPI